MALILIVDDSPTEVFVMQKALEKHGFKTAAADVRVDSARPSHTNRCSGRTNHKEGSQKSRYSSSTVTITCDAGAMCVARASALCSNVVLPPNRAYCTGDGASWVFNTGAQSWP